MKFYHATQVTNVPSILQLGLKSKFEGIYLCEKPEDAAKFLLVRGIKNLAIFEVNIRKNSKSLAESFDHSFTFFKCRAFIYTKDIPLENITNYAVYNFD